MRWLTNFYDFSFKWTATVAIGIHPTKAWLSQLVNFKMQSGREDSLEEWYAIKFCFKLGKKATETYGMLQTAFGASCMNQASVFEWNKRFKEGRESVRDDERCGRSKEVRTPELIGQIKNFMDKDHRVSIETISAQFDVSVGTVHTTICKELKIWKICAKFVPRVLREDQKENIVMTAGRWSNRSIQIPQFSMSTQFNCQKHFYFKLFNQLYITIQFSISTVSMSKTVQFQIIQFSISMRFKYKYSLIVKNTSISSYSV